VRGRWLVEPAALPAAAVAVVVALGFGLLVPVLPMYARSFGVAAWQVGLVVTAFAAMRLVADLPAGWLVERSGPARAVALGCLVVAVSSAAAGLAPTYEWLVALRGAGGIGSSLFSTGLSAYLLAAVPRERMGRATSLFSGAFLAGSAFGPTAGGLAAGALGLRGPFFLYAGCCAAAAAVALALLRGAGRGAGRVRRAHGEAPAGAPPLRWSPALAAALVSGFAQWWLLGGVRFTLVPLYAAEQLKLDPGAVGVGLTASALATLALLGPAGYAVDRYGRRRVGVPAFVGLALAAGALLLAADLPGYVVGCALFGAVAGAASVVPSALLADAVPPERAGLASGWQQTASDLGNFLAPVALGLVADLAGYPTAIALGTTPALLAAALLVATRAPRPLPAPAR
jgi:MFS family permease